MLALKQVVRWFIKAGNAARSSQVLRETLKDNCHASQLDVALFEPIVGSQ